MIWSYFVVFAIISVLLWAVGAWASWRNRRSLAFITTGLGLCVFFSYILIMWITLERPPLRTMGETRLWYSFFLPLAGMIVYSRWQYKWILSFSTLLATVFVCVNLFKPEIHSKTLMPALQSPWFAPHVIVYMMAYALLGAAVVMSVYLLFFKKGTDTTKEMEITDKSHLCWALLHDAWNAHGSALGKGSMGSLLGMGPKGNMGSYHLVLLSHLCSLPPVSPSSPAPSPHHPHYSLLFVTDVLVGYQLPTICAGDKRAYLQFELRFF